MDDTKRKDEWVTEELEDGSLVITEYNGKDTKVIVPAEFDGKVVSEIGEEALMGNSLLEELRISEGVARICNMAFYSCDRLSTVHLPSTLKIIEPRAFGACDNLIDFDVATDNTVFVVRDRMLYNKKENTIIACSKALSGSIHLPNETIGIYSGAFESCNQVTEFVLPEGLVWIDGSAFEGCSKIECILIPASVRYLDKCAFDGCENLREVSLPRICKIIETAPWLSDNEINILFRHQTGLAWANKNQSSPYKSEYESEDIKK